MNNDYYMNLHSDIVSKQGYKCPKCKRSLILADKLEVVKGVMYCGKCGELESRRASLLRELDSITSEKKKIAKARANYDRVRKNK